jgi:hypothetical protein
MGVNTSRNQHSTKNPEFYSRRQWAEFDTIDEAVDAYYDKMISPHNPPTFISFPDYGPLLKLNVIPTEDQITNALRIKPGYDGPIDHYTYCDDRPTYSQEILDNMVGYSYYRFRDYLLFILNCLEKQMQKYENDPNAKQKYAELQKRYQELLKVYIELMRKMDEWVRKREEEIKKRKHKRFNKIKKVKMKRIK